ncbi:MAG: ABC transporter ATP-binding protein, partial [Betaproteobacteria bacterium]
VMVADLINSISKEKAIVMIEHDMETALAFAEKILVLQYGKVIVDGDRDTVINDPKVQEVYLGH